MGCTNLLWAPQPRRATSTSLVSGAPHQIDAHLHPVTTDTTSRRIATLLWLWSFLFTRHVPCPTVRRSPGSGRCGPAPAADAAANGHSISAKWPKPCKRNRSHSPNGLGVSSHSRHRGSGCLWANSHPHEAGCQDEADRSSRYFSSFVVFSWVWSRPQVKYAKSSKTKGRRRPLPLLFFSHSQPAPVSRETISCRPPQFRRDELEQHSSAEQLGIAFARSRSPDPLLKARNTLRRPLPPDESPSSAPVGRSARDLARLLSRVLSRQITQAETSPAAPSFVPRPQAGKQSRDACISNCPVSFPKQRTNRPEAGTPGRADVGRNSRRAITRRRNHQPQDKQGVFIG